MKSKDIYYTNSDSDTESEIEFIDIYDDINGKFSDQLYCTEDSDLSDEDHNEESDEESDGVVLILTPINEINSEVKPEPNPSDNTEDIGIKATNDRQLINYMQRRGIRKRMNGNTSDVIQSSIGVNTESTQWRELATNLQKFEEHFRNYYHMNGQLREELRTQSSQTTGTFVNNENVSQIAQNGVLTRPQIAGRGTGRGFSEAFRADRENLAFGVRNESIRGLGLGRAGRALGRASTGFIRAPVSRLAAQHSDWRRDDWSSNV